MSTLISAMIVHAVFRSTPWDAHQTLNLFFKRGGHAPLDLLLQRLRLSRPVPRQCAQDMNSRR